MRQISVHRRDYSQFPAGSFFWYAQLQTFDVEDEQSKTICSSRVAPLEDDEKFLCDRVFRQVETGWASISIKNKQLGGNCERRIHTRTTVDRQSQSWHVWRRSLLGLGRVDFTTAYPLLRWNSFKIRPGKWRNGMAKGKFSHSQRTVEAASCTTRAAVSALTTCFYASTGLTTGGIAIARAKILHPEA